MLCNAVALSEYAANIDLGLHKSVTGTCLEGLRFLDIHGANKRPNLAPEASRSDPLGTELMNYTQVCALLMIAPAGILLLRIHHCA